MHLMDVQPESPLCGRSWPSSLNSSSLFLHSIQIQFELEGLSLLHGFTVPNIPIIDPIRLGSNVFPTDFHIFELVI